MANPANQNEANQLNIELSDDIAQGVYSNLVIVSHSPSEFVLDFVSMLPNAPARVKSRVVVTPEHAKRLLAALNDNVRRYEQQFGTIEDKGSPTPYPNNFNTPKAQA